MSASCPSSFIRFTNWGCFNIPALSFLWSIGVGMERYLQELSRRESTKFC